MPSAWGLKAPDVLMDARGWLHFNVGDRVEFSAADGSGIVHPISSKKPQDDRDDWRGPPQASVEDGTTGVAVALRGRDPIVRIDGLNETYGYRWQDVVNLTLEKDRKWARARPQDERPQERRLQDERPQDGRRQGKVVVDRGMVTRTPVTRTTSPPTVRSAPLTLRMPAAKAPSAERLAAFSASAQQTAARVIEDALTQVSIADLSGPRGKGWFVWRAGGKPYTGALLNEDPEGVALRALDAAYDLEAPGGTSVEEMQRAAAVVADAVLASGTPYVQSDLVEPVRAVLAESRGTLWFEDAVRRAWAAPARTAPSEGATPRPTSGEAVRRARRASVEVVVEDRAWAFSGARPSFDVSELAPGIVETLRRSAGLACVESVHVLERQSSMAVRPGRGLQVKLRIEGLAAPEARPRVPATLTDQLFG